MVEETEALKKIHAAGRGPCKDCENWCETITEEQRNTLHESVRECRCEGRGWCSKMQYPTRAKDGCSNLSITEFLKLKKEHGKAMKMRETDKSIKREASQRTETLRKIMDS